MKVRPGPLTIAAGLALTGGCGSFKQKSKEVKHEVTTRSELVGKWTSEGCVASSTFPGKFARLAYDFAATTGFTYVVDIFNDQNCSAQDESLKVTGDEGFPSSFREGANDINFTVHSATVTPKAEAVAKWMNDASFCGFTDWQSGYEKSVVGANCQQFTMKDGQTFKELFEIRGDTLYFGQPQLLRASEEDASRATSVDLGTAFKQQK